MKKIFILLTLFFPITLFALDFDNSLIGISSTKIRVTYGEPIEKIEYGILNKSSWVYPEYILHFKDNILVKIQNRNEVPQKQDIKIIKNEKIINEESNIVSDMFSNKK